MVYNRCTYYSRIMHELAAAESIRVGNRRRVAGFTTGHSAPILADCYNFVGQALSLTQVEQLSRCMSG